MTDKKYRSKPRKGPIGKAMDRIAKDEDKVKIKHQLIVEAVSSDSPGAWEEGGVRFVITDSPHLTESGLVEVSLLAADIATQELLPGLDNPYQFQNPPINVPDGTWRKEMIQTTEDPESLEEVDVPNFVEDPALALRSCITSVVINQARKNGWGQA